MAKQFPQFDDAHVRFIAAQPVFFVATAAPDGRINLSPKGMDSLRVLGPGRLVWLNVTGSGNETAAHLAEHARMTVMWCSFDARPQILRAYGRATVVHAGAPGWTDLAAQLPALPGARQIFDLAVDLVQTSCGYAVPLMELQAPRPTLLDWAERKGPDGVAAYWAEANATSLDGKPTGIEAARSLGA